MLLELANTSNLVLFLLPTCAAYCAFIAFCRLYLSPLSSIPGPWYAAVTDFWFTWIFVRFRRVRTIDSLHKKYGPVVRVSPSRVIFADVDTYKHVYGTMAKVDKHPMYKTFTMCVITLIQSSLTFNLITCFCSSGHDHVLVDIRCQGRHLR